MSEREPDGTSRDVTFDNYPIEDKNRADVEWLGTVTPNSPPQLYEPHSNTVYETELDEEMERVIPKNPQPLGEKSLGEYLEDIGEEHGWESLSEFARKHLEDESE